MSIYSAPTARSGFVGPEESNRDLQAQYANLRQDLDRLMAAPVKEFPRIDDLVDRLELLQLAIKEQHGIKGNNPNE